MKSNPNVFLPSHQHRQSLNKRTNIYPYKNSFIKVLNHFSRIIKTDDNLKRIIKSDIEEITWEELYRHFFANMTHSYQMTVPGLKSHVTKGKLEPIDIQISKRTWNKKVIDF